MVFFVFGFLGWNYVWLYDLVRVFKQPMHTTDQFLDYYKHVVYLTALAVACVFYHFRRWLYTPV